MRSQRKVYVRFAVVFGLLGIVAVAGYAYVLIHERFRLPFKHAYTIRAEFAAADGVVTGIGQPVDVVGVPVGQITGVNLQDGAAVVTMQLYPGQTPQVYANASAALQPITPLGDLRIDLDPGRPPAPPLPDNGLIRLGETSAPVPLSDLLSRLDTDTRDYLSGLLSTLAEGTHGQAPDMAELLKQLGPTTDQLSTLTRALADRRTALAQFVHNLATVTRAASQDGQLASVVIAGDQTLHAIAQQDAPLRAAIAKLPATLTAVRTTLTAVSPFTSELTPAITALKPAVRRLPLTFKALGRFADVASPVVHDDLDPLVTKAQPLLMVAEPAVTNLNRATPPLTGAAQTLNYLLNELGYVPSRSNPGFLFWADWALHVTDSALGQSDGNGTILRALILANCSEVTAGAAIQKYFDDLGICPA